MEKVEDDDRISVQCTQNLCIDVLLCGCESLDMYIMTSFCALRRTHLAKESGLTGL